MRRAVWTGSAAVVLMLAAGTEIAQEPAAALDDAYELLEGKDYEKAVKAFTKAHKPCVAAIPHLRKLSRRSDKSPFVIVGIASDSDEAKLRDFVAD